MAEDDICIPEILGYNLPMANNFPDFEKSIPRPLSEVEEWALGANPLMAAYFFHPDDPRHLEFEDVRAAASEIEEMAAAAGFGF